MKASLLAPRFARHAADHGPARPDAALARDGHGPAERAGPGRRRHRRGRDGPPACLPGPGSRAGRFRRRRRRASWCGRRATGWRWATRSPARWVSPGARCAPRPTAASSPSRAAGCCSRCAASRSACGPACRPSSWRRTASRRSRWKLRRRWCRASGATAGRISACCARWAADRRRGSQTDMLDINLRGAVLIGGICDQPAPLHQATELMVRGDRARLDHLRPDPGGAAPAVPADDHRGLRLAADEHGRLRAADRRTSGGMPPSTPARATATSYQRPEVIIPLPASRQADVPDDVIPLAAGVRVRVLRAPFHGAVGIVRDLPSEGGRLSERAARPQCNRRDRGSGESDDPSGQSGSHPVDRAAGAGPRRASSGHGVRRSDNGRRL